MKQVVLKTLGLTGCLALVFILLCFKLHSNPGIVPGLRDTDPSVRQETILGLWAEKKAHLVVPELMECLSDPNPSVRSNAILALNNEGSAAEPSLIKAIHGKNRQQRISAIQACGMPDPRYERQFSPGDDKALMPHILQCLNDPDDEVRTEAVIALTWVCLGAGKEVKAIRVLCSLLSDDHFTIRWSAIHSLGRIARYTNKPAELNSAIPFLRKSLKDKSKGVQEEAEWALNEIKERKGG
jgi:HEAT repeat protein